MGMQISARKSGTVTILDVRGRIVIGDNSDSFRAELRKLAESAPCDVLVNLAGVTGVDSSGISALVQSFVTLKRAHLDACLFHSTGCCNQHCLAGAVKQYRAFLSRLKQAREDAGLMQIQVAEKLCRPQSFVSKCESGERRVDFVELQYLAEIYQKPLSFFVDR